MAKDIKGKYPYKPNSKENKKSVDSSNFDKQIKIRQFTENENKNVIHGSNIKGYRDDFSKKFSDELKERKKRIRKNVLEYTADDAGNIDCFIKAYGDYVKYNCDEQCFYVWSGKFWMRDTTNMVHLWCQTVMRARRDYTIDILGEDTSDKNHNDLLKHVKKCCNQTVSGCWGRWLPVCCCKSTTPYGGCCQ